MVRSIMYLSRSRLSLPEDTDQLATIQQLSVARNRDLDLGGLLIVAPHHFAQYLEGDAETVDAVTARISRDPRHEAMVILTPPQLSYRRFPDWRLAWFGPDARTSAALQPILNWIDDLPTENRAEALLDIMESLSATRVA